MGNYKLNLILLLIITNIISTISQSCSSNLECKDTGCCHDDVCSPKSDCKKRNKFCYGFVGVGAFIILVIIVIYFIRKIKQTKRHLEHLRRTDPSALLNRSRRISMNQIPPSMIPTNNN